MIKRIFHSPKPMREFDSDIFCGLLWSVKLFNDCFPWGACFWMDPMVPVHRSHWEGALHLWSYPRTRRLQECGCPRSAQWQHHDSWRGPQPQAELRVGQRPFGGLAKDSRCCILKVYLIGDFCSHFLSFSILIEMGWLTTIRQTYLSTGLKPTRGVTTRKAMMAIIGMFFQAAQTVLCCVFLWVNSQQPLAVFEALTGNVFIFWRSLIFAMTFAADLWLFNVSLSAHFKRFWVCLFFDKLQPFGKNWIFASTSGVFFGPKQ